MAYSYRLARAEYVIANTHLPPRLGPNRHAKYIQTWHGTPIKSIGADIAGSVSSSELMAAWMADSATWTRLLAASETSVPLLRSAFGISPDKIISCGLPRNDVLVDSVRLEDAATRVRERYGEDARSLILYAPTSRGGLQVSSTEPLADVQLLRRRLAHRYRLLVRAHPNIGSTFPSDGEFVVDVSDYADVQDLLAAADVLVTDFSSLAVDFALLGRPILCLAPDAEDYAERHGMYFALEEVFPTGVCRTSEELCQVLLDPTALVRAVPQANGLIHDLAGPSEPASAEVLRACGLLDRS